MHIFLHRNANHQTGPSRGVVIDLKRVWRHIVAPFDNCVSLGKFTDNEPAESKQISLMITTFLRLMCSLMISFLPSLHGVSYFGRRSGIKDRLTELYRNFKSISSSRDRKDIYGWPTDTFCVS